jgi:hypothetical protein
VNVVETIQAVRSAGGSVTVSAGALIVDAPPELSPAVWDALATHKATLLELLAPVVTYADLAAQEEREAIQAEAEAPAEAVAFGPPRPARRCRLIRDTPGIDPHRGKVTFPAGLDGIVIDDLDEIEEPFQQIHTRFLLQLEHGAGRRPIVALIDGRPRVLDAASVEVLPEEEGDSL